MAGLHDIYQRLRSVSDLSVDLALGAALSSADPWACRLIAQTLLTRQHPQGTVSLVANFHLLPSSLQDMVVHHAQELYRPLREVASYDSSTTGPANVVRIIMAANAAKLAYLVTEQLHHRPDETRVLAAQCLHHLARVASTAPSDTASLAKNRLDAVTAKYIQDAVEEAVEKYPVHHQPQTLLALAALAPRPIRGAMRYLAKTPGPAVDTAGQLLRKADDPDIRRSLLVFVSVPRLTDAALDGIALTATTPGLGDLLDTSHLLLNDKSARPLQTLEHAQRLWLGTDQLMRFTVHQTRSLARWAMAIPMQPDRRMDKLAQLIRLPDPLSRLAVLLLLIQLADDQQYLGARDLISRFCDDPDPIIARIALRDLIRSNWPKLAQRLTGLIDSANPSLRQLAAQRLGQLGFERLWAQWETMAHPQKMSLGRALIKIDPDFHRHLSDKLASPDRGAKLKSVAIIQCLHQGASFEQPLLGLLEHPDNTLVSSATRALGSARTQESLDAVEAALEHTDARVRANAVEALQQLRSIRHVHKLAQMAQDEHNRPRANAIHGLMEVNTVDALAALATMLHDKRPDHRISALWLVDAIGLIEVARHVAEMSVSDPQPSVRARANQVVQYLIQVMDAPDHHKTPEPTLC